jgi:hypothetical protein
MSGAYNNKYSFGLNGKGFVISQKRGIRYYQKKRSPLFVSKFGGGDSSYRDATFWQYFVQTNWRNGAKQLKFDDAGKYWKSSDVDTTILEQLTLSKQFVSVGQLAAGIKVNTMEAWRSSASWYNSNYGYRQQLTITNNAATTAPVGYPIKVTIDTAALQTATHLRSDRKDWRIVYDNGSTLIDLPRDYVSTTATFFGLQTAIGAGANDSHYYAYYGYSAESTDKQPTTNADWNNVYGMYGVTPDANTIAIYHMKEGTSTSLADSGANSLNGTLTNGPSWDTDGKFGRDINFNPRHGDKYVNVGNSGLFNLGSMTLEMWIKLGDSGSNRMGIIVKAGAYEFRDMDSKFWMNIGGQEVESDSGYSSDGKWHHIAATYDGVNTGCVYVDGVLKQTKGAGSATSSNGDNVYIGGDAGDSSTDSKIQHVRISNIARTSFPYVLSAEPTISAGSETTTQPPSSSFDLYAGGSDGVVYKWDGTSTWTPQFDTRRITMFETTANDYQYIGDSGGTEYAGGQVFQVTGTQTIKGVELSLEKANGTPGDITVRIETETASKPSGTLVNAAATLTIPAFTTATYGWISADFAVAFGLTTATNYWIVVTIAAGANDNNYKWGSVTAGGYAAGNNATSADGGATWTAGTKDHLFRLKGNATEVNCMKLTSQGGTQKLYIGTGDPKGQANGDARLFSFDGSTWSLVKSFVTATESMINSIEEYSAASKVYLGVGPQARIYESSDMSTFTLSKDINVPQNPGYVYALKEYNRVLHAGGGSPEFLPSQYYNGFVNIYDTTAWNILYPFDFTVIKSMEFYDAYLFMGTYHGHLYVYDTSTLNPLFNFKDQYAYKVQIKAMKYFDDKLYMALYPQDSSNETNVGIWLFDRRGLSLAYTIDSVVGYRCFAVVNGSLFVGTGDNGYVYKLDTTYKATGWTQLSYFDANLPSIPKLWNNVVIRHEALLSGHSISAYYRFKETDSWVLLGTSDTIGDIEKSFAFTTGITSNKITLKLVLTTSDQATTPTLTEVVMQYALYPVLKWQWNIKIKAIKNLRLLDGTYETRTAEQIRQDIESLLGSEQLYVFNDVNGETFNVLVHDIDTSSWVINSESINEEEVALTLLQS